LQELLRQGNQRDLVVLADMTLDMLDLYGLDESVQPYAIMAVAGLGFTAAARIRDIRAAERFAATALAAGRRLGPSPELLRALGFRAHAYEMAGDLVQSAATYEEGLAMIPGLDQIPLTFTAPLRIGYSELLMSRGQHDQAKAVMAGEQPRSGDAFLDHIIANWAGTTAGSPDVVVEQLSASSADAAREGFGTIAAVMASNAGTEMLNCGRAAAAIPRLREACAQLRSGDADEYLAVALMNLGLALEMTGDGRGGTTGIREAWDIIRVAAPASPKVLPILYSLARRRFRERDFRRARASADRGLALYDTIRPRLGVREAEHAQLLQNYRLLLDIRLRIALQDGWPDQAADLIERGKARFWAESLASLGTSADAASQTPELDPRTHVLSFFVNHRATFVAHGRPGSVAVTSIDTDAASLRVLVEQVMCSLLRSRSRATEPDPAAVELSEVLRPVLDLNDADALLVLPDGPLWNLAFEALPWSGRAEPLGEIVPITITPGLGVTDMLLRRSSGEPSRDWRLVALGDPASDYGSRPEQTRRQLEQLAELDPSTVILAGNAATRENLRSHLLDATHLHFAGHAQGEAAGAEPFLVLSDGAGRQDRVHAAEIASWRTRADLVFLYGCTTQVGPEWEGEGLDSLARAFLFAGAACVVSTPWPVGDSAGVPLVADFYRHLRAGATIARAAVAARSAARQRGAPPRAWASLRVLGDGLTLPTTSVERDNAAT
jgi:CHAT domain-containing protein